MGIALLLAAIRLETESMDEKGQVVAALCDRKWFQDLHCSDISHQLNFFSVLLPLPSVTC
jgi:hypothetical protein